MLCSICNSSEETFEHTWICPLHLNNVDFVIDILVIEALEELNLDDADMTKQLKSIMFSDDHPTLLADLVQGFVTKDFVKKINNTLMNATSSIKFIPWL